MGVGGGGGVTAGGQQMDRGNEYGHWNNLFCRTSDIKDNVFSVFLSMEPIHS